MKSSFSKSWDLREGKTVQSWRPDEIFPSLTSEDMNPAGSEVLRLFQPAAPQDETNEADTLPARSPQVSRWNLSALESIAGSRSGAQQQIPGVDGVPVRIAQDEKQRLIAEAHRQAEEITRQTQNAAREILMQAQEEAEQIRQAAHEEGRAQASAEMDLAVATAARVVAELSAWRGETIKHGEPLVIDMVKRIAHLIFGEGFLLDEEILQVNMNRVMRMAESMGDLRVYLNPRDLRTLDPEWKKFQESLSGKKIQIIASENIQPGGCYVQGEMGVVDARVDTQLNAVMSALTPENDPAKGQS